METFKQKFVRYHADNMQSDLDLRPSSLKTQLGSCTFQRYANSDPSLVSLIAN